MSLDQFPHGTVIYQQATFVASNGSQQVVNYPLSTCVGRKKALLIGIRYMGTNGQLNGCHNDVINVRNFLCSKFGFSDDPSDMVILMDDTINMTSRPAFIPTRLNILNAINWLVSGNRPGDSLVFHFSGHGGRVHDRSGDEADGYDETILPLDYQHAGQILDDELHTRLVRALPPGVRLTAIFDSCHSGTALDLPYVYDHWGRLVPESNQRGKISSTMSQGLNMMLTGNAVAGAKTIFDRGLSLLTGPSSASNVNVVQQRHTYSDVIMFSSCRDDQTAADARIAGVGATGAMSYAFLEALGLPYQMTYTQLLTCMRDILARKYFGQVPQLSSGHPMDMNMLFRM